MNSVVHLHDVGSSTSDRRAVIIQSTNRGLTTASLFVADALSLTLGMLAAVGLLTVWRDDAFQLMQFKYALVVPSVLIVFWFAGLYEGVLATPPEDLRRTTLSISVVFAAFAVSSFISKTAEQSSRSIFLVGWATAVVAVPIVRGYVRRRFSARWWWGYPALILGAGTTGRELVNTLIRHPEMGLKPVAVLDDDPDKAGDIDGVPVLSGLDHCRDISQRMNVPYLVVAMPGVSRERVLEIVDTHGQGFSHILLIPDLHGIANLGVEVRDLQWAMGLEVRQQLFLPWKSKMKRISDIVFTLVGSVFVLPLFLVIAIGIKLESRGPVFYRQDRWGKDGTVFGMWKFRSMVRDADAVLQSYLDENPELKREWDENAKLKDDPRVTRLGRLLRKTSLDELPQLINVLMGQMSLVGPRALPIDEAERYAEAFPTYCKVLPGMSGLWQVSGRTDTTYDERIRLDVYYVRNWSFWLDMYILAKTIDVVVRAKGAY